MDSLNYKYVTGTNKLDHVRDSVSAGNYSMDIDDQSTGNYAYDKIGNMISDDVEGITNISWTAHGKIRQILKNRIRPHIITQFKRRRTEIFTIGL